MLILCLLALLLAPVPAHATAPAAAPADTTDRRVQIGFQPRLGALYSNSKGFGLGGEVTARHLVGSDTELAVMGRIQQRYGQVGASFFTGDPFRAPLFAGLIGFYTNDRVRHFYGLGPRSLRRNHVYTSMESAEAEVRLGWHPSETGRWLVQPVVRLLHHHVHAFRDRRDQAFLRLDPTSQRNLFDTVGRPTTGVTYGLEVAFDTRDRPFYSSEGALLLVTARRYDGLGDNAFRYYATSASAYGFVPLQNRQVLFGRAVLALTHPLGDTPLPFYALPVVDDQLLGAYTRFRFAGHDLLVLTLGYRVPVYTFLDWFSLDANVQVSAANAYDDLFDQFKPGLTFATDLREDGGRTALRPSLSVGADLVNLDTGRIVIGGQMGVDPEGYRFGTLRFVYGIRAEQRLVR